MYDSRPHAIIITLENKLYRIPEVAPPTTISSISVKQWSNIISWTELVQKVINPWDWIPIPDIDLIQCLIVNTKSLSIVLLLYQHDQVTTRL